MRDLDGQTITLARPATDARLGERTTARRIGSTRRRKARMALPETRDPTSVSAIGVVGGHYQGAHSRRATRILFVIWLGALVVEPDVAHPGGLEHELANVAFVLTVVALCDWWFARRMGVTIDERGLTLHYAFNRSRVPWADVEGYYWRRWRSPSTDWIWIRTAHGRPVRIPTIQRAARPEDVVAGLLASSDLRSAAGAEVDAMTTLTRALSSARQAVGSRSATA
jgi:hypothetical protein